MVTFRQLTALAYCPFKTCRFKHMRGFISTDSMDIDRNTQTNVNVKLPQILILPVNLRGQTTLQTTLV